MLARIITPTRGSVKVDALRCLEDEVWPEYRNEDTRQY